MNSSTISGATKSAKPVVRKKFAVPPVKVACLDCRASRTRCDGKQECSNCVLKGKICTYAQSRRGGSRIRKRQPASDSNGGACCDIKSNSGKTSPSQHPLPVLSETATFDFLSSPMNLVSPGAGLKQLDMSFDDTEFIFDSIFNSQFDPQDSGYGTSEKGTTVEPEETTGTVRVYLTDESILNAYYVYIHPYFPILPPPEAHQVIDQPKIGSRKASDYVFSSALAPDFEPSTPLSLAISASLALIPHPSDPSPASMESTLLRREQAQAFAQSAIEGIEIETELMDSNSQPGEALSNGPHEVTRKRFHPQAPLENESILALIMLSTYEYAQRGNIAKMKNRAGQALIKAMDLGLHSRGNEEGLDAEANRRAWWMTYICVCQGSIFSNSQAPILLYDPRFTTLGPTFASDIESWSVFLQAQQIILSATQFVIDLEKTLKTNSDTSAIWTRMLELESIIEPLVASSDAWSLSSTSPGPLDWSEMSVAHGLRGIARIKLNSARIKVHRYGAFSDVPVFTKKHCDLAVVPKESTQEASLTHICPCSSTFHSTIQGVLDLSSEASDLAYTTNGSIPSAAIACGILPFSSHFSAKVCLRAAFNIARAFQALPFPPSTAAHSSTPPYNLDQMDMSFDHEQSSQSLDPATQPPRMVPMFACCAMQGSYAMVMLSYKSRAMGFVGGVGGSSNISSFREDGYAELSGPVKKLLERLEGGLGMILGALKNYSIAYEALGGMRDQIEVAARSVGGSKAGQ